ncbi:MAG: alpha/beta fold hydrolase [Candidatus Lokiarchaeota archaeon]|nr:alpha/beta fold hydrolase [Candidatus Lokiarchaeota archaeon]
MQNNRPSLENIGEKTLAQEIDGVIRQPSDANVAFLLIHGFGAAPDEVASYAEFLYENNIASFSVRIAGHDTNPEDLATKTRFDWYNSVTRGLEKVRSWNTEYVFVGGLSMGGALALHIGEHDHSIDGLVVFAPALRIENPLIRVLPILKRVKKYRDVDLSDMMELYDIPRRKYEREPLSAIHELVKLTKEVRDNLHQIEIPVFIIHGTDDKTINPQCGKVAFRSVSSVKKKFVLLEGAQHVITCHPTRKEIYPVTLDWIHEITAG